MLGALIERFLGTSCGLVLTEDVRSLALPGSYQEKVTHLGRALLGFTRLKHLDLSRNAIESLEVGVAHSLGRLIRSNKSNY